MSGVNKTILIGRLGQNPESRHLENGRMVVNFSLATSEKYKDRDGNKQQVTEWHSCVAWGKLAEIIEKYVKKGDMIFMEGKLKTRSWDDKQGVKRYATEVVCENMTMLDSKKTDNSQSQVEHQTDLSNDDDLPF